jgi:hypothetical protein
MEIPWLKVWARRRRCAQSGTPLAEAVNPEELEELPASSVEPPVAAKAAWRPAWVLPWRDEAGAGKAPAKRLSGGADPGLSDACYSGAEPAQAGLTGACRSKAICGGGVASHCSAAARGERCGANQSACASAGTAHARRANAGGERIRRNDGGEDADRFGDVRHPQRKGCAEEHEAQQSGRTQAQDRVRIHRSASIVEHLDGLRLIAVAIAQEPAKLLLSLALGLRLARLFERLGAALRGEQSSQIRKFPFLREELDPVTGALGRLVTLLDTIGIEAFVPAPPGGPGRPPAKRRRRRPPPGRWFW